MNNWFKGFFKNKRETSLQLLLIVGIAITANLLGDELLLRLDLTEDNRYTLSPASEDIAESLDDPVTVTAYFSENMPPQLSQAEDEFRNFLEEFRAYSDGNLEYRFVNPSESNQTEQEAQQAGVRPLSVQVRERDQVSQQRAYLGALFQYGGKREVVPVIRPGSALEYTIASTIKQLTVDQKPKIGLLQGHGEPTQQEMTQVTSQLSQMYQITEVSGLDTAAVPADIEVLIVVAPEQQLSQEELLKIDQYLMAGGRAIFAINTVRTDTRRGMATPMNTGIERLLSAYNTPVNTNLVLDANAANIQVQQQQGAFQIVNQVQYPYIPLASNFGNHPISQGLETVMFQFVSSVDTSRVDSSQALTPLVLTSDQAGVSQGRFNLNPMQEWNQQSFMQSHVPLGVAVEGTFASAFAGIDSVNAELSSSQKTSIVVFGDGDFVINGRGQQQQQQRLPEDNVNLMVNSVDWLADDTGLIELRTQGVTNRPLVSVADSTKTVLKYLNTFLPIALVIGYGIYRYQRRKIRRRKWIEAGV
ncbi:Gldg family protein [Aliifodinibius sp. S!AR15-10]|uniref:GldG family protein n=1 Tax=Aliifodinibius sp. S!AR15-10 TaxID=2950437 RepID=UPI002863A39B|nr:Gldg family protein [Aliifodinibius sp. S!AR15-10]MDR8392821.1 Gldg family protein [Aliifodinibius sp. S!AR15-10]